MLWVTCMAGCVTQPRYATQDGSDGDVIAAFLQEFPRWSEKTAWHSGPLDCYVNVADVPLQAILVQIENPSATYRSLEGKHGRWRSLGKFDEDESPWLVIEKIERNEAQAMLTVLIYFGDEGIEALDILLTLNELGAWQVVEWRHSMVS